MYENHNSLFLITCIAIITILLGGLFVHTSLTPKTYKSSDFVSSVVQTPEKKISNRADVNGIFTYGPYINLDKGQYNILSIIQVQRNRNLKLPMATVVFISMTIYCLPEKIQRHSNLMYLKIFLISP